MASSAASRLSQTMTSSQVSSPRRTREMPRSAASSRTSATIAGRLERNSASVSGAILKRARSITSLTFVVPSRMGRADVAPAAPDWNGGDVTGHLVAPVAETYRSTNGPVHVDRADASKVEGTGRPSARPDVAEGRASNDQSSPRTAEPDTEPVNHSAQFHTPEPEWAFETAGSRPVAAPEADSSPEPGMGSVRPPGFLRPVRAISGHH